MTYEELKKLATPGPWQAEGFKTDPFGVMPAKLWAPGIGTSVADTTALVGDPYVKGGKRIIDDKSHSHRVLPAKANAALIAHCVNHFDEALEALKNLADRPDCNGPDCYYCDSGVEHPKLGRFIDYAALIAKLETVEDVVYTEV